MRTAVESRPSCETAVAGNAKGIGGGREKSKKFSEKIWLDRSLGFFKTGVQLLYCVVLVSAEQQSESAICIYVAPPSCASLPPHSP